MRAPARTVLVLFSVAGLAILSGDAPAAKPPPPQGALVAALADELHAAALYEATIFRHGIVEPFASVFESELAHVDRLLLLFEAYGIEPPYGAPIEHTAVPGTVRDACRLAAANERATIVLYGRLLDEVTQPDVRALFARLREVARVRHLPAFERCAARRDRRR